MVSQGAAYVLASSDGIGQAIVIAVIAIAVIVRSIVEYFRKQKAEQEAKERKLREASAAGREGEGAPAEAAPPPAPTGLQALLDALEARTGGQEKGGPAPERGDVWDVTEETALAGEDLMEPETLEHERARAAGAERRRARPLFDEYREARRAEAQPAEPSYEAAPALGEVGAEVPAPAAAGPPLPAPVVARLLAGPGGPPVLDQARKGVLWSVVLGPPRGVVPYGDQGGSEPPGGVV